MDTDASGERAVAIVADDHALFRMALAAILSTRLKFTRVIETPSLDEALERLADTPDVRLALFDLAMPGMAGAASLAAVRECYPRIKAAVVSGSIERNDVLQALQAGVHGYIPKGIDAEHLAEALRMILDGWIYVPAFVADLPPGDEPTQRLAGPAGAPSSAGAGGEAVALSPRQREVLELLVLGRSNKEIARTLNLGEGTIKVHMAALFRALGVNNRSSAVAAAVRMNVATTR